MIVDVYQLKEEIQKAHPSLVGASYKAFNSRCLTKNLVLKDVFEWESRGGFRDDNLDFAAIKENMGLRRGSLVVIKNSALGLDGAYYVDANFNPVEFDKKGRKSLPNGWISAENAPDVAGTYYVQSRSGKVFLAKYDAGNWSHKNILYWQPKPLPFVE